MHGMCSVGIRYSRVDVGLRIIIVTFCIKFDTTCFSFRQKFLEKSHIKIGVCVIKLSYKEELIFFSHFIK